MSPVTVPVSQRALAQMRLLNRALTRPAARVCGALGSEGITLCGLFSEMRRVPDVIRYILVVKRGKPSTLLRLNSKQPKLILGNQFTDLRVTDRVKLYRRIVLVIESPHKDEYDAYFKPIAPAQGETGEKIRDELCALIDRHPALDLPDGRYELVICNPVQFQASLHEFHGESLYKNSPAQALRDKTWRTLYYDANEKAGFLRRLSNYDAAAVIVACTARLKAEVLRDVQDWSQERVPVFCASEHPCVWNGQTTLWQAA